MKVRSLHLLFFYLLISSTILFVKQTRTETERSNAVNPISSPSPIVKRRLADGCFHVFLDVGANIGVHGRFLFEPKKYPQATVARAIFDKEFGEERDNRDLCAFEFEPNPKQSQILTEKSLSYKSLGWRYEIVPLAASDHDGTMQFHHNMDERYEEWGFSVKELHGNATSEKIPVVRLSAWIRHHVSHRKIPANPYASRSNKTPSVVMKMDIEGSEYVVLPDLIFSGILCDIDFIFGEFHPSFAPLVFEGQKIGLESENDATHYRDVLTEAISTSRNCKTRFQHIDDESYLHDGAPLPSL